MVRNTILWCFICALFSPSRTYSLPFMRVQVQVTPRPFPLTTWLHLLWTLFTWGQTSQWLHKAGFLKCKPAYLNPPQFPLSGHPFFSKMHGSRSRFAWNFYTWYLFSHLKTVIYWSESCLCAALGLSQLMNVKETIVHSCILSWNTVLFKTKCRSNVLGRNIMKSRGTGGLEACVWQSLGLWGI